jgi:hypothetical protein
MAWIVEYHEDYLAELRAGPQAVRVAVVTATAFLEQFGPPLGRPYVDTLKGSFYPNMKELRITVPGGEWRIAFAFDPRRNAILLTGGSKSGVNEKKFYKSLIHVADRRYAEHLAQLQKTEGD